MINYDLSIRVIVIPYCISELLNLDQESTNTFPPKHIDRSKSIYKSSPYLGNYANFWKKLSKNSKAQFTVHSPSRKQQNLICNHNF